VNDEQEMIASHRPGFECSTIRIQCKSRRPFVFICICWLIVENELGIVWKEVNVMYP
jgi:hypothetical protein